MAHPALGLNTPVPFCYLPDLRKGLSKTFLPIGYTMLERLHSLQKRYPVYPGGDTVGPFLSGACRPKLVSCRGRLLELEPTPVRLCLSRWGGGECQVTEGLAVSVGAGASPPPRRARRP